MASERASDPTCTCPSGDGSLRWPCPKHPAAAAHEAVGEVYQGSARRPQAKLNAELPVGTKLYAAPVTAAPVAIFQERSTHSVYRGSCGSLPCYCWAENDHIIGDEVKRYSTPEAPGIDLSEVPRYTLAHGDFTSEMLEHSQGAWVRLGDVESALIDASPKGTTLNEQFGSAEGLGSASHYRQVLERIATQGPHYGPDGTRETWKHWSDIARDALADSPKGGSEERDAARYRHLRSRRDGDGPAAAVRCLGGPYFNRAIYGDQLDKAVDADIQAQATGTEECAHNWVDARNQVVKSGELCTRCGKLRASDAEEPPHDATHDRCESGSPECGPVEHWDSEGVPLCAKCWDVLQAQPAMAGDAEVPHG
ncbi:hypothetical protein [Stenotrophomonas acidaminiphila]|uniref:hypothetical protein n=1 Tax=Stenotrophomonas acidaminiphila TaxID=128780 RepID=UPI001FAE9458|nr:hypothetical protein [Stenotrophomonas acidaminiphila]